MKGSLEGRKSAAGKLNLFPKIRIMSSHISENQKLRFRRGAHFGESVGPPRHFSVALAALRLRATALARIRSIWPLGRVTQISPIHSSFTPMIGLALKLVRLTMEVDRPRSMVFR